jgi:hypothetical protein
VPSISKIRDFNGGAAKIDRLALEGVVGEAMSALRSFKLIIEERTHANGTKGLRKSIDDGFAAIGGWAKLASGGTDWRKSNDRGAWVGVEVQVSGRSDMLAVDIMHLKEDLTEGKIDVGLIIVPDDVLSRFLTDRTPNFATAIRHAEHRARDLPIRVLGFRHDGVGDALSKMRTNLGRIVDDIG